jgi:phosphoglycerol transferase MdoB-like AlkP superfamily enzyme
MIIFIVLSGFHAFAFLIISVQLLIAKPTTRKVIIPLIIAVVSAFILLVSIDFFIEFHLLHHTPKETYSNMNKNDDEKKKKKGKGFKMGYLIIYSSMCVVSWFIFLAYKNLEEEIEKQKRESEPMEITISHIT